MRFSHVLIALAPLLIAQTPEPSAPASLPVITPSATLVFDAERAESCLAEAREAMRKYDTAYRTMERFYATDESYEELRSHVACERTYPASVARERGIPPEVFMKFEGGWRGTWAGVEARHLWVSVSWNVQLVIVEDAGQPQRAINYIDGEGAICGIVQQADGNERPHEGRWFPATGDQPETLVWLTPDRNYYERAVIGADGTRGYRIDEQIPGESAQRGVQAAYRPWKTALERADLDRATRTLAPLGSSGSSPIVR